MKQSIVDQINFKFYEEYSQVASLKKPIVAGQNVTLETIGPNEAKKILQKVHARQSGRNNEKTIEQYARDISRGFWNTSVPQMIAIDSTGALIDGWHRLNAVIQADQSVQFWVMRNADPEAFKKTDLGLKRSMAFNLGATTEEIALANAVIRLSAYPVSAGRTTGEQIQIALEHMGDCYKQFLTHTSRVTARGLSQTPIKLAVVLNIKKHPAHTLNICNAYNMLVNRDFTNAPKSMNTLKRKIEDDKPAQWKLFAYAYKAFNPHSFHLNFFRDVDHVEIIRQVREEFIKDLPEVLF